MEEWKDGRVEGRRIEEWKSGRVDAMEGWMEEWMEDKLKWTYTPLQSIIYVQIIL